MKIFLKNTFIKLAWLLRRAMCFYLVIFFLIYVVVDYEKVRFGLKVRIIENFMPSSFRYLTSIVKENATERSAELKEYIKFYEKVNQFFPNQVDTLSMLGFCYSKLGDTRRAVFYYNKAIQLDPQYFWPYYNLGLIYFKNRLFKEARAMFQQAILCDLNYALNFIHQSKVVYRSIALDDPLFGQEAPKRLREGYKNAYVLLLFTDFELKDYSLMLKDAHEAMTKKLDNQDIFYFFVGLAEYELKEFKKAVYLFKVALKHNSRSYDSYYYLGLSYQALKEKESAQEAWKNIQGKLRKEELGKYYLGQIQQLALQIF